MTTRWYRPALAALLALAAAGVGTTASDNYGAIAAAPGGAYGYAYDHPSRAQAERAALRECGDDDCVVKVWFKNNCGAYARGRGGEGWAYADSREEAESLALDNCRAHGRGCEVVCWACNSR
jgi:serine/threonine-protein kinase